MDRLAARFAATGTFLGALLLAALTPLPGGSTALADSQLEAVKTRGRLIVLCFPSYDGAFSRPNLDRGPTKRVGTIDDFAGIDIDLAASLARRLGVTLEVRTLETPGYSVLIPALLAGQADLVISSLSITEQRRQLVDFSAPYFSSYSLVVARIDAKIAGPADLAGKKAVAIPGSSHHEYLVELGVTPDQFVAAEFTSEYLTTLADGDAEVAVLDSDSPRLDLSAFPNLTVAFSLPKDDHYGIALPKGSDLLPAVNEWLKSIRANGELAEILRKNPYR